MAGFADTLNARVWGGILLLTAWGVGLASPSCRVSRLVLGTAASAASAAPGLGQSR